VDQKGVREFSLDVETRRTTSEEVGGPALFRSRFDPGFDQGKGLSFAKNCYSPNALGKGRTLAKGKKTEFFNREQLLRKEISKGAGL